MQGAREYATLFKTGQYGKLYLISGEHARGKTFHIWVLPSDDPISVMPWSIKDAVEVYGITGGQPGWTETYGWLHRGRWEHDFAALVCKRRADLAASEMERRAARVRAEEEEQARIANLLSKY